jgi:hypothetical protein
MSKNAIKKSIRESGKNLPESIRANLLSLRPGLRDRNKFIENNRKKYETMLPIDLMLNVEIKKIKSTRPIYNLIKKITKHNS